MAASVATNIANLEAAIASGVLQVEYDGKKTTFRSLDEMLTILSRLKAQAGIVQRPKAGLVSFDRGDT